MHGRHDRNAEINVTSLVTHAETAVLRHTALSDVEFRHNLDARNQRLMIGQIDWIDFRVERAVDSILNLNFGIASFDMNVRSA